MTTKQCFYPTDPDEKGMNVDEFLNTNREWHAFTLGFLAAAVYAFTRSLVGIAVVLVVLAGTAGLVAEQGTPLSEEPWYAILGIAVAAGVAYSLGIFPI